MSRPSSRPPSRPPRHWDSRCGSAAPNWLCCATAPSGSRRSATSAADWPPRAERTRVAREMHDIVGHSLSVIVTLADGGAYAADTAPQRSKEALRLIGDTGRRSLTDLRRMLGVLREQTDEPSLHPSPASPTSARCANASEPPAPQSNTTAPAT
ncbi:histidine kinase dimerization/phosphoacceptor domain-containing protein [Micromonospora sp. NPDC023814]|uniref:histidine kinase dimerization/phosphoacceptor domain-containing protein n=1 Tax=Micromonospora sp. NPDC023814 TaxID=3154596 RepID=UPI00340882B0